MLPASLQEAVGVTDRTGRDEHRPPQAARTAVDRIELRLEQGRGLFAVQLDLSTGRVSGEPISLAPKAVIDWLNGRAKGYTTPDGSESVLAYWTTGKVAMTGTSYEGTLPLAALSSASSAHMSTAVKPISVAVERRITPLAPCGR